MQARILIIAFLVGAVVAGGLTFLIRRSGTESTEVVADAPDSPRGADPAVNTSPRTEPAPAPGEAPASSEDLVALEADNRRLEAEIAALEARVLELQPEPLDPDAFRFGLPAKTPAFDKADWSTLSGHAGKLSKLLLDLKDATTSGVEPTGKLIQDIRSENHPLAMFAVAFGGDIENVAANAAYTHPAVVSNMVRAALLQTENPLTRDQEIAIKTLGDAWVSEHRRETASQSEKTPALAKTVAEVDAKLRFLASMKRVLTVEQREFLFHPQTEGRLQLDLLSPALVYVLSAPVDCSGRDDMEAKLLAALFETAGVKIEDLTAYAWIGARWVDEIPGAYDPQSVRSVDLRYPHIDAVQARARAQAAAIERVLAMGALQEADADSVRAVATLLYPYVLDVGGMSDD